MAVGDEEATTLGVRVARARLLVILAASFGTAAAVAVSGLIGFVGIIVPHTVRLMVGGSYRRIMPMSMILGAAFLVVTDLMARTLVSPAELPIGVITALIGAPFFLVVLRTNRLRRIVTTLVAKDVYVTLGDRLVVDRVSLRARPGRVARGDRSERCGQELAAQGARRCGALGWSHRARRCAGGRPAAARAGSRLVAMVAQNPVVPDAITVAEYALLGRTPHLGRLAMEGRHDVEIVAGTLAALGIEELAARHVQTLSGGERQRVLIARALVQDAPVLLLDEPTTVARRRPPAGRARARRPPAPRTGDQRARRRCTTSRWRAATPTDCCCSSTGARRPRAPRSTC